MPTDKNGFTLTYVIVIAHSVETEPMETLLDCSGRTECVQSFEVEQLMFGEYKVGVGTMTPVGKTVQHNIVSLGKVIMYNVQ